MAITTVIILQGPDMGGKTTWANDVITLVMPGCRLANLWVYATKPDDPGFKAFNDAIRHESKRRMNNELSRIQVLNLDLLDGSKLAGFNLNFDHIGPLMSVARYPIENLPHKYQAYLTNTNLPKVKTLHQVFAQAKAHPNELASMLSRYPAVPEVIILDNTADDQRLNVVIQEMARLKWEFKLVMAYVTFDGNLVGLQTQPDIVISLDDNRQKLIDNLATNSMTKGFKLC